LEDGTAFFFIKQKVHTQAGTLFILCAAGKKELHYTFLFFIVAILYLNRFT